MPYVQAGAAMLIPDEECGAERFREDVERVVDEPQRWLRMAEASRASGRPDADEAVVALIREAAA